MKYITDSMIDKAIAEKEEAYKRYEEVTRSPLSAPADVQAERYKEYAAAAETLSEMIKRDKRIARYSSVRVRRRVTSDAIEISVKDCGRSYRASVIEDFCRWGENPAGEERTLTLNRSYARALGLPVIPEVSV